LEHIDLRHPTKIGVLSARIGSISDNQLGGWHSYRASKAALNMLVKNIAIELERKRARTRIVAMQPGTTDSRLSQPFQRNLPPGQLQTPDFTANCLIDVLKQLPAEHNGLLVDFTGQVIPP